MEEALLECHEAPTGHFGVRRTFAKIRQGFFWLEHRVDVKEWCRRCYTCSTARKSPKEKGRGPLRIYNVGAPFERVALGIIGPLPKSSNGNKYALVVVDYFSKWLEVIPLPNQRATTIAAALPREVVSRHGISLELHSDRSFESAVFKFMQFLRIKKTRTTSLHSQSDGLVERMIRTLLQYLSLYITENQKDWDQ